MWLPLSFFFWAAVFGAFITYRVLRILNVPITDTSLRPFAAPLLRACATDAVCADLQPNAVNPLPPTFWNARGFDLQYKLQSSWKTMAHESRSLKCELKEFWQGTDYGTHIEEEGVCNLTCAPYEGPDRAKLYVEIALETAGVVPAIVIQGILPRSLRLIPGGVCCLLAHVLHTTVSTFSSARASCFRASTSSQ